MVKEYVTPLITDVERLIAGDVLLCYSPELVGPVLEATGSCYAHAAICLSPLEVADATEKGVRKSTIYTLLDEYAYIAVKRNRWVWSENRVSELNAFVNRLISDGVAFNYKGMARLKTQGITPSFEQLQNLDAYFRGDLKGTDPLQDKYFCSELVAAAFYAVGIWSESVAVIFDHRFTTPAGISDEATFGEFIGYLVPYQGYRIDRRDPYFGVGEWFENGVRLE